jgi:hypothetical protein
LRQDQREDALPEAPGQAVSASNFLPRPRTLAYSKTLIKLLILAAWA